MFHVSRDGCAICFGPISTTPPAGFPLLEEGAEYRAKFGKGDLLKCAKLQSVF